MPVSETDGRHSSNPNYTNRKGFTAKDWHKHEGGENSQLEEALHNDRDCREGFSYEKPVHRLMAEMSTQGYSHAEIARHTGFTAHHVSNVLRQPYMRDFILKRMKGNVMQEMKDFLEAEVMPSLQAIKGIRDDTNVGAGVRKDAAMALIERFAGKAVQPIQEDAKPPSEMSEEELQRNVESILTGRGNTN